MVMIVTGTNLVKIKLSGLIDKTNCYYFTFFQNTTSAVFLRVHRTASLHRQTRQKGHADLPAVAKAYRDGRQETLKQCKQKNEIQVMLRFKLNENKLKP